MYIVTNAWKSTTEGVWEEGEVGQRTEHSLSYLKGIQFNSISELTKRPYLPNLPKETSNWKIFDGRLQCNVLEVEDGTEPNESEMKRWEKGEIKMYSCTYEFIVKKVEDVNFDEMAKQFGITNETFD